MGRVEHWLWQVIVWTCHYELMRHSAHHLQARTHEIKVTPEQCISRLQSVTTSDKCAHSLIEEIENLSKVGKLLFVEKL